MLAPREKRLIRGVLATVAIITIVLIVSIATAGKKSAHGCISVSLPYSTGGARSTAAAPALAASAAASTSPGLNGAAGQIVARACRKAGCSRGLGGMPAAARPKITQT